MNTKLTFAPRSFPARVADLGFTARLPVDWISHDLPREEVDFTDPTLFLPLAVLTAPHAAIVFAFGARPAYEDGTLQDWAWYHLNHNRLQPAAVGRMCIAGVSAVTGEATQASEMGPMVVRFAFLEDGNRLLNLSLTAPELFADSVRDAWFEMVRSFLLETPRGSRFPIEPTAETTPAAPIPEPWLESKPAQQGAIELLLDSESGEPLFPAGAPVFSIESNTPIKSSRLYDFALSNVSLSLDEDHPINVNLRNRGVGLIPNIAGLSDEERRASLASGAITANFDVPYGWHVIDDGRRALILEPSGKIQISLNLIPRHGRTPNEILDGLEIVMRKEYPSPEFVRIQDGKIQALGARNISDGAQPLEQYHLLFPFRDDSMVLRARVTATPAQAGNACNLAQLILETCVFESPEAADAAEPSPEDSVEPESGEPASAQPERGSDGKPIWWEQALAMEANDQLEAAETHIRDNCPYIGFAYSTAEMYRQRMIRLQEQGDPEGALKAFLKSSDFIWRYASMATSGGEGAALSLQRDEFRAQLVAVYGSDPEAEK